MITFLHCVLGNHYVPAGTLGQTIHVVRDSSHVPDSRWACNRCLVTSEIREDLPVNNIQESQFLPGFATDELCEDGDW